MELGARAQAQQERFELEAERAALVEAVVTVAKGWTHGVARRTEIMDAVDALEAWEREHEGD